MNVDVRREACGGSIKSSNAREARGGSIKSSNVRQARGGSIENIIRLRRGVEVVWKRYD